MESRKTMTLMVNGIQENNGTDGKGVTEKR